MLQWAYTEIVSGRARFDGRSTLKTWLFGVVRNLTRSYWRRQWRRLKFESAWSAPASAAIEDSYSESASTQTALLQAFAQLPTRQREVLELVFHRDLTLEQAAAVMGVSLGSARTHYERGKRRLREMLGVTQ
jgi:RNA polymerase sigma-70 factor (ECF subfamily)